jgi:hypothetical protein
MYFHTIVPHQVTVLYAFKYTQLLCHPADCSVIIWLQLNLFHCHQFTSLIVNSCVHFTKSALTCKKNIRKSHQHIHSIRDQTTVTRKLQYTDITPVMRLAGLVNFFFDHSLFSLFDQSVNPTVPYIITYTHNKKI